MITMLLHQDGIKVNHKRVERLYKENKMQLKNRKKGRKALDRVSEKWSPKYPHAMKRLYDNWDVVTPIFKFSKDVRKIIYTTNAIESLNSSYRN